MKKRSNFYPLLLEFISVVFAVLLALALNSYKETIDTRKRAESLKISIYEECKRNKVKIDSIIINNKAYINFLDSIIRVEDKENVRFYFDFSFELLDRSVWNMAQNSDAFDQMDKDFTFKVSGIYENQRFLYDFSSEVFIEIGTMLKEMSTLKTSDMALSTYFYVYTINHTSLELQEDLIEFLEEYAPPEKQ